MPHDGSKMRNYSRQGFNSRVHHKIHGEEEPAVVGRPFQQGAVAFHFIVHCSKERTVQGWDAGEEPVLAEAEASKWATLPSTCFFPLIFTHTTRGRGGMSGELSPPPVKADRAQTRTWSTSSSAGPWNSRMNLSSIQLKLSCRL